MSDKDDLPTGWTSARLEEVAVLNPSREKIGLTLDEPVHFVPMAAVRESFGGIDVSTTRPLREVVKGYTVFRESDVIFAKITPCMENGKLAVVPTLEHTWAFGSTEFHVLRPTQAVCSAWLAHYLSQTERRRSAQRAMTGSAGQLRVPVSWLAEQVIPIPPLPEQRRIVAKIEELFSDLDAGVAALERVRANLKRYRASVLKAAVEGKLTEDWRAQHPDTEPASVLLERILTERRRQWEKDQLAKFAQAGKQPPKGWEDKFGEPGRLTTVGLPKLPASWTWANVGQVADIQGGIQKQPSRKPVRNKYPFLRVANVLRGRLDLSEVHEIELFDGELERLRLQVGDLLIVEGNGSKSEIGRSSLWNGAVPDCVHQNHIIRARLLAGSPEYLDAYWNSPAGTKRISEIAASTSGLYTLSVGKITSLPVPLPPEEEQEQIVSEVERRLSIVDEIEAQVDANLKRAARLRQGILKRAFEGKLVPQDPTDEPASVLLERIRAERSAGGGSAATRGRGRKRRQPS